MQSFLLEHYIYINVYLKHVEFGAVDEKWIFTLISSFHEKKIGNYRIIQLALFFLAITSSHQRSEISIQIF